MSMLTMLLWVWGKRLYLPIWCQNMARKFDAKMDIGGEGGIPRGPYLPVDVHMPPSLRGGGPCGTVVGWNRWYHCRWRASISCSTPSLMCGSWYLPRFLSRRVIGSDVHGLLYSPGDALGIPIHYGEAVKLDGMTYGVCLVIDGEGPLRCSLYLSPNFLLVSPMYSILHPRWSHLYL